MCNQEPVPPKEILVQAAGMAPARPLAAAPSAPRNDVQPIHQGEDNDREKMLEIEPVCAEKNYPGMRGTIEYENMNESEKTEEIETFGPEVDSEDGESTVWDDSLSDDVLVAHENTGNVDKDLLTLQKGECGRRKMIRKAGCLLGGGSMILSGTVMFFVPVPTAFPLIFGGMVVLAREFPAAQRQLDISRDYLEKACSDQVNLQQGGQEGGQPDIPENNGQEDSTVAKRKPQQKNLIKEYCRNFVLPLLNKVCTPKDTGEKDCTTDDVTESSTPTHSSHIAASGELPSTTVCVLDEKGKKGSQEQNSGPFAFLKFYRIHRTEFTNAEQREMEQASSCVWKEENDGSQEQRRGPLVLFRTFHFNREREVGNLSEKKLTFCPTTRHVSEEKREKSQDRQNDTFTPFRNFHPREFNKVNQREMRQDMFSTSSGVKEVGSLTFCTKTRHVLEEEDEREKSQDQRNDNFNPFRKKCHPSHPEQFHKVNQRKIKQDMFSTSSCVTEEGSRERHLGPFASSSNCPWNSRAFEKAHQGKIEQDSQEQHYGSVAPVRNFRWNRRREFEYVRMRKMQQDAFQKDLAVMLDSPSPEDLNIIQFHQKAIAHT